VLALLFAPRHGLVWKGRHGKELAASSPDATR
jgi:hypothetical protein